MFTSTETIVGPDTPLCAVLKYSTWEKSQNLEKYRQRFVIIKLYSVLQMVGGDRWSNPVFLIFCGRNVNFAVRDCSISECSMV